MTAHAFATSVIGRALPQDTLRMTEQETQRVIVLANPGGISQQLLQMCHALAIELVAVASHHDLPFRLHHHRPMAIISELDPK